MDLAEAQRDKAQQEAAEYKKQIPDKASIIKGLTADSKGKGIAGV